MLGIAIELLAAIVAISGALAHARRARGTARAIAAAPVVLYAIGQLLPNAVASESNFSTLYPIGLVVMAAAGALGAYLMLRRDPPAS